VELAVKAFDTKVWMIGWNVDWFTAVSWLLFNLICEPLTKLAD
jgi:hypothetical protein